MVHRWLTTNSCRATDAVRARCNNILIFLLPPPPPPPPPLDITKNAVFHQSCKFLTVLGSVPHVPSTSLTLILVRWMQIMPLAASSATSWCTPTPPKGGNHHFVTAPPPPPHGREPSRHLVRGRFQGGRKVLWWQVHPEHPSDLRPQNGTSGEQTHWPYPSPPCPLGSEGLFIATPPVTQNHHRRRAMDGWRDRRLTTALDRAWLLSVTCSLRRNGRLGKRNV